MGLAELITALQAQAIENGADSKVKVQIEGLESMSSIADVRFEDGVIKIAASEFDK